MSALQNLLHSLRESSKSEREKGTYFEELCVNYFRNEPIYKALYSQVQTFGQWAASQGLDKNDAGIDLVATTFTGEHHAIQCKFYAEDYRVQKSDIDSFFTASGKRSFSNRIIVATTNNWSSNAEDALIDQHPPVTKIDLLALESSVIDWSQYQAKTEVVIKPKKTLREHQVNALRAVQQGFKVAERGKLIMACGTGKTFTSLRIAEDLVGKGGRVLFLVPSLSLLSQTLTEWTQESEVPLHNFAVCSDSDVGKKRKADDEVVNTFLHELRYPATTDSKKLAAEASRAQSNEHMTVVYSTYHSIEVISKAQLEHGMPEFDLIICDEAHRTTGASFEGEDESAFVRVHDATFIHAKRRLYMTATPRIYGDSAKVQASTDNVALYSMDDKQLYGEELYVITFSEAVRRGLLVDYKVIVLAIEESHVNRRIQDLLKDPNNQLRVDDAAKIIGCWKALSKQGLATDLVDDASAMKRAVAFCQVIEMSNGKGKHKVSSKQIARMFQSVVEAYQEEEEFEQANVLRCEVDHVDGSMNAGTKEEKLAWLKSPPPENTCRILSNVRCLSEGVDVPSLDAVLFLTPRNSQVDVVQSVGRVMRTTPDGSKKRGYVILPVVIPAGVEPHVALGDNETYKVVWQVLQALRSHDDKFNADINKIEFNGGVGSKIEVVSISDKVPVKPGSKKGEGVGKGKKKGPSGKGSHVLGAIGTGTAPPEQVEMEYEIGEIERAIYAKLVQKVGNRHHWEEWANDIAKIARTHIDRIQAILENESNTREIEAFNRFVAELKDDLNDSITEPEVVEMLAQHMVTKPVFEALFEGYSFATENPMSKAMQGVLDILQEHHLEKEAATLERFYESVKMRADGIDNAAGKQKIVVELYDKFFRNAFPKMTERLGIVYTPVEVVDFIIHSVNDVLKEEFGQSLGSKGVHIIDPFTGTGTFITRLLQSGLITPEQLPHKYKSEIHANEIVLLAYYIAAINIEAVYHSLVGGKYQPFEGICLTDTFQMYEKEDLVNALLLDNSARRKRQKKLDIRVIFGNPPYSAGQTSANDNNANIDYPHLDSRIRSTYAERSKATLKTALYDSYIRAIRWASDRIGDAGVIGFVTNAGFVEANTADGLRKCLVEEFSSLYVFHLRGNQRTQGELSRKEGGKIFGSGSRAPIAISLLVKNPQASQQGQIHFHDIGDYLSREDKLEKISAFASISGIRAAQGWQAITPDAHGDWLKQRDDSFGEFIVLGGKDGNTAPKLFENYSNGVKTNRDAWCYNASRAAVENNMQRMIDFYNREVERFSAAHAGLDKIAREAKVDGFIDTNPTKISWDHAQKIGVERERHGAYTNEAVTKSLYRPFTKSWLYFDRFFNNRVYQMPRIFPDAAAKNRVIQVNAKFNGNGQIAIMSDVLPDLHCNGDSQCFPLYLYDGEVDEENVGAQGEMFVEASQGESKRNRRYALTKEGLAHFSNAYPSESVNEEDVFYYVYGLLHSQQYRDKYQDNLSKELPRIPCVKTPAGFWGFSQAGRKLAELHLGYETVTAYPLTIEAKGALTDDDYRVEQMKYGKRGKDKDLTTLHYNHKIMLTDIPLQAYDYIVNGKPALDWVVERQRVKTDKNSGIVNDANLWATETMGNPRYPLELFCRVVTVSVETMKIVKSLPQLEI
jgi:predicted helicase